MESFDLAAFLVNGAAAQVIWGTDPGSAECAGDRGFAWYDAKRPNTPAIDVLGIADLDADGTLELLVAIGFEESRSIAVYQADQGGLRLERIAMTTDSRTF